MDFREGQIHWLNALILRTHARIVSGAYKVREVYHGTSVNKEQRFTDDELLQEELAAMGRQIQWLDEAVQGLRKKA